MADFLSVVVVLAVCFAVGRPLVALLPRAAFSHEQLAAPVLGFGWICVSGTILYRLGISPSGTLVAILIVAAIALALYIPTDLKQLRRWASGTSGKAALAILVLVVLLAVTPGAIGGLQFSALQGNPFDQMNYLATSIVTSRHPYSSLPDILQDSEPGDSFTMIAAYALLNIRPSVCIGYEILRQTFAGYAYSSAYVLIAALQIMVFLGLSFLVVNVVRLPLTLAAIVGAAGALGFFTQYVIDINAWSHLSSLSAASVALTVLIVLFTPRGPHPEAYVPGPSPGAISARRAMLAVPLVIVPIVYLYPEMLAIAAPAAVVAFVVVPLASVGMRSTIPLLWPLGLGIGLSIVCALGHWDATIGLLTNQIQLATRMPAAVPPFVDSTTPSVENNWHLYYQRYVFDPAVAEAGYHGIYAAFAAPVDFFYGLLGLYFLRPPAALALWLRFLWKLALLAPMLILLWGIASNAISTFRRNGDRRHRTLFAFVTTAIVLAATAAIAGLYWTAGKGFNMVAPVLLTAMAIPLTVESARRSRTGQWYVLCFWAFVAAHLSFGIARPIAVAMSPTGIHYQAPPYPSVHDPAIKTTISWDIRSALDAAATCRHVAVNLEHPILEAFVEMALTERGVSWTSQRPINGYYGMGRDFGRRPSQSADCLLTTTTDAGSPRRQVVVTRISARTPTP